MKAESTIMPASPYEITFNGDYAEIEFFTNITESEVEEGEAAKWEYDHYRYTTRYRDTLITSLDNNYDSWLAKAIEKEEAENTVVETEAEKIEELESALEILILDILEV